MGAQCEYESLQNARISENKFVEYKTLEDMGAQCEYESLRNARISENKVPRPPSCQFVEYKTLEDMGAQCEYESLRNARISENKARLASLGIEKTVLELNSLVSPTKRVKSTPPANRVKSIPNLSSPRRSNRLKAHDHDLRRSDRLKRKENDSSGKGSLSEKARRSLFVKRDGDKRPANAPFLDIDDADLELSADALARRCNSKSRGSVYDPVFGICCHFCRQKKLCGEEDCKRCGNLDVNQPCIGKTDCSICHSTQGVLCRACLKVRYGEEMEEVRENKEWMCPHCIEDRGVKPYWICNSSFCLKKRKMVPTGIAIFQARELGFKSVAHLLMDKLQKSAKGR